MQHYTPRRASARRLQGAPPYVLDVFDDSRYADRYVVVFNESMSPVTGSFSEAQIAYLSMSRYPEHPQCISVWSEMGAYSMKGYRSRHRRHRISWLDLPEQVREHVQTRAAATEEG